ncbi:hypothetical protein H5410_025117 [Solanum commersonii]|uniref:Uncharacterized protein n=1 Tax=Solanum commersonii TaxID=4109 RepID=A0A9J5YSW1_SOLCO|nr:hypothetical protein H5410_025117 [Solanum commersonii]
MDFRFGIDYKPNKVLRYLDYKCKVQPKLQLKRLAELNNIMCSEDIWTIPEDDQDKEIVMTEADSHWSFGDRLGIKNHP